MKILVTSTSFQDAPGKHHFLLAERVKGGKVDYLRGPLTEAQLLEVNWDYDGVICGDDQYSEAVLKVAKQGGLKILSKYGVGLDKIDLVASKNLGIEVRNCLGVNHETVAEHTMALMLAYIKNIPMGVSATKKGKWLRTTNTELKGKTLLILGLGRIGKEVAKRAVAFGMKVVAFDKYFDQQFADQWGIAKQKTLEVGLSGFDFISLHCNLDSSTRGLLDNEFFKRLATSKPILINTARAELVDRAALRDALKEGWIKSYLTDVWYEEPIQPSEPLKDLDNIFITAHVGSRTIENVEQQGSMSVNNLFDFFEGQ